MNQPPIKRQKLDPENEKGYKHSAPPNWLSLPLEIWTFILVDYISNSGITVKEYGYIIFTCKLFKKVIFNEHYKYRHGDLDKIWKFDPHAYFWDYDKYCENIEKTINSIDYFRCWICNQNGFTWNQVRMKELYIPSISREDFTACITCVSKKKHRYDRLCNQLDNIKDDCQSIQDKIYELEFKYYNIDRW